jgi:hypothetical protein
MRFRNCRSQIQLHRIYAANLAIFCVGCRDGADCTRERNVHRATAGRDVELAPGRNMLEL